MAGTELTRPQVALRSRTIPIAPSLFSLAVWRCMVDGTNPAGGTPEEELNAPDALLPHAAEPCCCTSRQTGRQYDEHSARPHVSRFAKACHGSSAGELRLLRAAQPGRFKAGRACGHRRQAGFLD